MAGKFTFFWSILVPMVLLTASVAITYLLYRHFAGKVHQQHEEMQKDSG